MKIIIIGGSFSSLKIASLLSNIKIKKNLKAFEIHLLAQNSIFTFLPLIPDWLVSKKMKLKNIQSNLEIFSKNRNIYFVNTSVNLIDSENKEVSCSNGKTYKYDILISGRGDQILDECKQTKWGCEVKKLSQFKFTKEKHYEISCYSPGIAEFEVLSALIDTKKNVVPVINVINKKERKFRTHPILSQIKSIHSINQKLDEYIKFDFDEKTNKPNLKYKKNNLRIFNYPSIFFIGGEVANSFDLKSSAQFASFDAKLTFLEINSIFNSKEHKRLLWQKIRSRYKPRGQMLFIGKYNSFVWMNKKLKGSESDLIFKKEPIFKGIIGRYIRFYFYSLEMFLFYSDNKPNIIFNLLYQKVYLKIWNLFLILKK